ncbi:MAG: acyl-CoA thioesterase [Gemmatimonadales bacterium]
MTAPEKPMAGRVFEVLDRIRWNDSDASGIVYYGAYVRLFQVAEEELFRACGLPFEILRREKNVWIPRKAFHVEFHSPAELDEEVAVQAWFTGIGTTSITMQFEVYRASDRAHRATGTLTVVSVDKATRGKKPLPGDVKASLSAYLR